MDKLLTMSKQEITRLEIMQRLKDKSENLDLILTRQKTGILFSFQPS